MGVFLCVRPLTKEKNGERFRKMKILAVGTAADTDVTDKGKPVRRARGRSCHPRYPYNPRFDYFGAEGGDPPSPRLLRGLKSCSAQQSYWLFETVCGAALL